MLERWFWIIFYQRLVARDGRAEIGVGSWGLAHQFVAHGAARIGNGHDTVVAESLDHIYEIV